MDTLGMDALNSQLQNGTSQEILKIALAKFSGKIAFSSSFSAEDIVVTDMLLKLDPNANIFTLDTGRLNPETYNVIDEINLFYNIKVATYFPDAKEVEDLYQTQGINGFYESLENRKKCCQIRKVTPLKRALAPYKAWITGLRTSQSATRESLAIANFDSAFNIVKINPILNWSDKEIWEYIDKNHLPYNKLHKKGYPSIGCAPCTRAVKTGDDVRSGRWWWEDPSHKECGLHKT